MLVTLLNKYVVPAGYPLLIIGAITWIWGAASGVQARDPSRSPTIAMITWRGETRAEEGFEKGLKDFGYTPRYVKFHCNQNLEQLNRILPLVKQQGPDLIYVFGTTATTRVVDKIKSSPVVFNIVTRPVESGIIANWQSSGNNATGVSSMVPIKHQIKALQKVVRFKRLGIIYNPFENNSIVQADELERLARTQGVELAHFLIFSPSDVDKVLGGIEKKVDAVYLPSDSTIKTLGKQIMARINAARLPSLAALKEMVIHDGAMMGLSPDYYQLGGLAAGKAHEVLAGKAPSDIPAVTSDHFNIIVNLHTAKAVKIHIPTSVLVMADKIIR